MILLGHDWCPLSICFFYIASPQLIFIRVSLRFWVIGLAGCILRLVIIIDDHPGCSCYYSCTLGSEVTGSVCVTSCLLCIFLIEKRELIIIARQSRGGKVEAIVPYVSSTYIVSRILGPQIKYSSHMHCPITDWFSIYLMAAAVLWREWLQSLTASCECGESRVFQYSIEIRVDIRFTRAGSYV